MMDRLYDDGIGVVVVCAVCIPVVTVLTSLRMWVRWRMNNLGTDDYLLVAGLVSFWKPLSLLFFSPLLRGSVVGRPPTMIGDQIP